MSSLCPPCTLYTPWSSYLSHICSVPVTEWVLYNACQLSECQPHSSSLELELRELIFSNLFSHSPVTWDTRRSVPRRALCLLSQIEKLSFWEMWSQGHLSKCFLPQCQVSSCSGAPDHHLSTEYGEHCVCGMGQLPIIQGVNEPSSLLAIPRASTSTHLLTSCIQKSNPVFAHIVNCLLDTFSCLFPWGPWVPTRNSSS